MDIEIEVCTTKPIQNAIEYGGKRPDGSWAFHGEQAQVQLDDLAPEEIQKIADARAVLLKYAKADAVSKGLIPAPAA